MPNFELSNHQRKYFGLSLVDGSWDKQFVDNNVAAYFDKNRIVKNINYKFRHSGQGYFECDTDIETMNRRVLIPKNDEGKKQKLTVPRLLK